MAIPLIPWEPCNIPEEVQAELNRRRINRALNFVKGEKGAWSDDQGEWVNYRGPMTPWVRFCSNGAGKVNPYEGTEYYDKQGFVLYGGKDFYSSYGFLNPNQFGYGVSNPSVIGYMPNGIPHTIDNDVKTSNYPIHVPPPEIERMTVTIQKELYRRAAIEWVCFSPKQLEYMTPYFLIPGISCIVEWGWNHFDPDSLLNLDDVEQLKQLRRNPYPLYNKHILQSRGNYDVLFGIVTHFEWSIEGTRIRCRTEITSPDRIYSGLTVDSSMISNPKESKENIAILDSLKSFVDRDLPNIKVVTKSEKITEWGNGGITELALYLKRSYPEGKYGTKWKELMFGIFYGRDFSDINTTLAELGYADDLDFDKKNPNANLWINMGLLCEILNYHSHELKGFKGDPMFKVDIDDCVINGHPNLISTDGGVMLIPNSEAPKYFYGGYGYAENVKYTEGYKELFGISDSKEDFSKRNLTKEEMEALGILPDYRVWRVCQGFDYTAFRDDLDYVINHFRYSRVGKSRSFAFPFASAQDSGIPDTKPYPRRYAGYLKDLYFNVKKFQEIVNESKTFTEVLEKVLTALTDATAGMWDLRLVDSTGSAGISAEDLATMKIVDYRFILSINRGSVYVFDYFDAESLLQNIKFTPTISYPQAIRTMYAETNNPDNKVVLSDTNELLDYVFKDRLFLDETKKKTTSGIKSTQSFRDMMQSLQRITPSDGAFQMTTRKRGGKEKIVKRLAMPSRELLTLMLDDTDIENNPRYTGIMPGIQAQFTIQGIGGLRTFMMFLVRNLPEPYSHKNIVFRIIDLTETVEAGRWQTVITAGLLPLRNYIKERLGITGEL